METAKDNVIQLFPEKRTVSPDQLRIACNKIEEMNSFLRYLMDERVPNAKTRLIACSALANSIAFHALDALAAIEMPKYLTPAMAAELCRIKVNSLAKDRQHEVGMPFMKCRGKIFYDREDVLRKMWLDFGFTSTLVDSVVADISY